MAQNAVVLNAKQHNYTKDHNATVTVLSARPRILIPGTSKANDGLVLRMRSEGPTRVPADLEGKKFFAEWGIDWLEPVREFVVGEVSALNDQDRARLQALSLLRYVHDIFASNELAARKALSDAAALLIDDNDLRRIFSTGNPDEIATTFYPAFCTREIKGAQVVTWRTAQRQFLPAIYCPDVRTASFLAVSYRGLAACLNCHKIFSPDAPSIDESTSEKYCTAACGQRYRQKIYRLRVKASPALPRQSKSKRKGNR